MIANDTTGQVSLKRIAEAAGVSVTTVSRVLREKGEISQATRSKVLRVAKRLRYRPNLTARGVYWGKTNTVGVIIPAASNFDVRIVFGIHDQLAKQDIVPITLWSGSWDGIGDKEKTENVLKQIHHLVDRRVDGVIVRPHNTFKNLYIQEILERNIPLVTVDRNFLGSNADFVGTNDMTGGTLATQHLLDLGHRRLVHIAGPFKVTTGKLRRKGFEAVLGNIPGVKYDIIEDRSFGTDPNIVEKIFDLKSRPTAVFAANDKIAQNIYIAARSRGLRIPQDLSVVGFADLDFSALMDPPLTTVRQHPYEIGKHAAEILIDRIESKGDKKIISRLLEPELVERKSTCPCHSKDKD